MTNAVKRWVLLFSLIVSGCSNRNYAQEMQTELTNRGAKGLICTKGDELKPLLKLSPGNELNYACGSREIDTDGVRIDTTGRFMIDVTGPQGELCGYAPAKKNMKISPGWEKHLENLLGLPPALILSRK